MILKAYKALVRPEKLDRVENFITSFKEEIQNKFKNTNKISNLNVFFFENQLFFYIESIDCEIAPDILFDGIDEYLCEWPDENKFFRPMACIFHYNEPQSNEHWERKSKPTFCYAMIAKIIPDLMARYIFYHYQYQEEYPGDGDKYGRIFLADDMLFFYLEYPSVIEKALHKGSLDSKNSPKGKEWQEIMDTHFIWWDEKYTPYNAGRNWIEEGYPVEHRSNQWLYIKNILTIV